MPQIGERETDVRGAVWVVTCVEREPEEPTIVVRYQQVATAPITTTTTEFNGVLPCAAWPGGGHG